MSFAGPRSSTPLFLAKRELGTASFIPPKMPEHLKSIDMLLRMNRHDLYDEGRKSSEMAAKILSTIELSDALSWDSFHTLCGSICILDALKHLSLEEKCLPYFLNRSLNVSDSRVRPLTLDINIVNANRYLDVKQDEASKAVLLEYGNAHLSIAQRIMNQRVFRDKLRLFDQVTLGSVHYEIALLLIKDNELFSDIKRNGRYLARLLCNHLNLALDFVKDANFDNMNRNDIVTLGSVHCDVALLILDTPSAKNRLGHDGLFKLCEAHQVVARQALEDPQLRSLLEIYDLDDLCHKNSTLIPMILSHFSYFIDEDHHLTQSILCNIGDMNATAKSFILHDPQLTKFIPPNTLEAWKLELQTRRDAMSELANRMSNELPRKPDPRMF